MRIVRNILERKANFIFSIPPETTVYHALELMMEKNISALLVTKNGKLAGIFTERDYARKIVLKGKSSKETLIQEVMTTNPVSVSSEATIEHCMYLMTHQFIRHLPVIQEEELVGVVSIGDLVKSIIEEQQFIIENLENYITGTK